MAKLYFRYGAMGSSKSAQALITKFNYEEKDMQVWLMKPAVDTRDGEGVVKSQARSGSPCLCGDSGCGFVCTVPERGTGKTVL